MKEKVNKTACLSLSKEQSFETMNENVAYLSLETEKETVAEITLNEPQTSSKATFTPKYYDNDGNEIDIKLSYSLTANIIQSDETVKSYYSELKNHILSYMGVKSRISWKFDSYYIGINQLFKIKLRGKTICLYCNLDPNEFDKSEYHHEAIDTKIFENVPMLVKIKSGLGLKKAKELVDIVMVKFEIEKNPKAKEVDYVSQYPYEENEPLIARGLIKALIPAEAINDQTKGSQTKEVQDRLCDNTNVVKYNDGAIYRGEMLDGKLNGQGKLTFTNGEVWEGEFADGILNGQGKMTVVNGNVWEGEFKDGKLNGQGKITFATGTVVKGKFKDDILNGQGKITFANGTVWEGEFKDGKLINEETFSKKDPEKETQKSFLQKIMSIFKKK